VVRGPSLRGAAVGGEVPGEVPGVLADPADVSRSGGVQEVQPEEVEAGRSGDYAPVVDGGAAGVEDRQVDPAEVGAVAGRPDHGGYVQDSATGELRLAPGAALDPECGADFKVQFDDWGAKIHDGTAYCPFCGYHGEITGFNTPEQQAYINQIGLAEMQRRLGPSLQSWARESNRLQPPRTGPLAISFRWDVSA
jgi:hypothetical protein